ncbi:uncharacterized protein PFL1_00501 [Pseudozyma flocculosa PF-1]|uniref:Related to glycosyl hydrolase n=1 Tax=Pseudozyma flocculosa TaxID=84751 RepID=A0A5C3ERA0_9BASI|nr:uncharacterized protein PFL1_00501 [Pseudozyma flocculosa PF-1]EPQ32305.1 hypothetical protein PFL1_00501 [Pseudozyma flocculosa PF-1]SPO34738.1 related to glycosyl hydrolase [Pseudozyma flocculosa]
MGAQDWSTSPVTGEKVGPSYIHASDFHFRDTHGRAVLFRGINLSGSSKAPLGQPSQRVDGFWDDVEAGGSSFVGQPLNLDDGSADVHLSRLRAWGFNCIRYVFTWEALEHSGPRKYDYAYIDYTVDVLRKIKSYGFKVFMDPHQDLFSRFTGGSGAPYWVLIACGINPRNLSATQAAFLQCEWPTAEDPKPIEYPDMLWATNYTRLGAATLSALFFGGRQFAPLCVIDGQNIQDWLQDHYLSAVEELAKRIVAAGDLVDECVIGWDSINEPNQTYISLEDLSKIPKHWMLRKGPVPSPIQSLRLGSGQPQTVENYVFGSLGPKRAGSVSIDPKGKTIWLTREQDDVQGGAKWGWQRSESWPLGQCLWAAHGVWDVATGELLRPDYFHLYQSDAGSMPADFVDDYWLPHWRAYAGRLRKIHREAIMFMQPPVFEPPPRSLTEDDLRRRTCVSCHFYDGLTLITKHWNWFNADAVGLLRGKYASVLLAVRVGNRAIRDVMRKQLGYLRADTVDGIGAYPTLIGEIGIPYDLDGKKTYFGDAKGRGVGDYSAQTLALDASLNACDGDNVLNYTAWTYCPDNVHKWGDGWNGEDLSLWSLDDVQEGATPPLLSLSAKGHGRTNSTDKASYASLSSSQVSTRSPMKLSDGLDPSSSSAAAALDIGALSNGSRSIAAFCRPYPFATCGTPVNINFDIKTSEFTYVIETTRQHVGRGGGGGGNDDDDDEDGGDEEGMATEIYVPYMHYAEARPDTHHDAGAARAQNTLSIDVAVSAGRWKTRGQVLFWYLSAGDVKEGDKPTRHHIKIRRRTGAFEANRQVEARSGFCTIL